jgi:hypothetical protein
LAQLIRTLGIEAPTQAVWSVLADFGGVARWALAVRKAGWSGELRSGVGCGRTLVGPDGVAVEEVVTRWEEGRSLTFEIPGGLARFIAFLEETWTVEAGGGGSIVTVDLRYRTRLSLIGAVLASLIVRPVLASSVRDNLAGLKRYVETGAGTHGG